MERLIHLVESYPLDFVAYLSSLLPIFIGLITFRFHRPAHRSVWLLFVFLFVKDTYSLWYVHQRINNFFIQNLETAFETGLVGLIYYQSFSDKLPRRIILYVGILTVVAILLTYTDERISLISLIAFRFYSIGLALAYFNKIIADLRIRNVLKHTLFWFTAGLLAFVTGTFFTSLFSEFIFDPKTVSNETFDFYWNINNVLSVMFSLLSALGLWMSKYDDTNIV